jgi:ppGpp synthetase/RelA/SpoT-type nucleotidyltranferase
MARNLTEADEAFILTSVQRYLANKDIFDALAAALFRTLTESEGLRPHIHSVKSRAKDPEHFAEKLRRKLRERSRRSWGITNANLFQKINDLVGLRILHLHTSQIEKIDPELKLCLRAEKYEKLEGPIAKTWDMEYRRYFESIDVTTEDSPSQYTSVHYVFGARNDLKLTFEIQVRTLAEELWGEVNHRMNYPEHHQETACTEQIAVLARVTSSCTRLVDSIVRSDIDLRGRKRAPVKSTAKRGKRNKGAD